MMRSLALLGVFALSKGQLTESNSNLCISLTPAIAPCNSAVDEACCDGVLNLVTNLCECNEVITGFVLATSAATIFGDVQAACRATFPDAWAGVAEEPNCADAETFNYGCDEPDIGVDIGRLRSQRAFQQSYSTFGLLESEDGDCFNATHFIESISTAMTEDTFLEVPWGIGRYTGPDDVAEYIAISFESLNRGMWRVESATVNQISFSADGSELTSVSTWTSSFFEQRFTRDIAPFTLVGAWNGCETDKAASFTLLPNEGSRDLFQVGVWAAQTKTYGAEDICRYHTQYCFDNPDTRQYDTEEECLENMRSLPLYTEQCGPKRPHAGNSLPCKWKHHFMVPAKPELHCAHIGYPGAMDPNGDSKCTDDFGCSADQGQADWPDMIDIGDDTPADIAAFIEELDADYLDEPFACIRQRTDGTIVDNSNITVVTAAASSAGVIGILGGLAVFKKRRDNQKKKAAAAGASGSRATSAPPRMEDIDAEV